MTSLKLFATDTNDNVTAYCFDLNGVLSSTENLSNAQVAALETQQIIDINNDGTVGVTVLDELVSRYSDASSGMANSSEENRYLYNTSNGLLISRDSLSAQNETDGSGSSWVISSGNTFDLRYQYNQNDSWNGPSLALLTNADGSQFDLSIGLTVQKVIALRDGSDSSGDGMDDDVSGFQLFATDTNDNVTAYTFDLNGVLSSTENLSDSQVAALETQQIIDINNDGTVGVTVLDELYVRYGDSSGDTDGSEQDTRNLYRTSHGLLISIPGLDSQNETDSSGSVFDLRYESDDADSMNGPRFALLSNSEGGSEFELSSDEIILGVGVTRENLGSTNTDATGFVISTYTEPSSGKTYSFNLKGQLTGETEYEQFGLDKRI